MRWGSRTCAGVVLALSLVSSASCDEGDPPRPPPAPMLATRLFGVLEGFYGPPFTEEARLAWIAALGAMGANTYVYGPKDDPYHRAAWRDPYPEPMLEHFAAVASAATAADVRFVFAISPGAGFDPGGSDPATLLGKIDSLRSRGVCDFAIFFDDVTDGSPGADPAVQVEILLAVREHLRAADPDALVAFVPNYYFGTAEQLANDTPPPFAFSYSIPPSAYYRAYDRVPTDVAILWTGRAVFASEVPEDEAASMRAFTLRPTLLWDNVPVNDNVLVHEPYLGPWVGREHGIFDALDGVLLNLMALPSASAVTVDTARRARDEGPAYDPWQAWDAAIEARGGDALRPLAEHFQGHPFIGDGTEAGAFAPLAAAFLAAPSSATEAPLRGELERLDAQRELLAALSDTRLVAELAGPSEKLELLAQAGLYGLDQWVTVQGGGTAELAGFAAARAEAEATDWAVGENLALPSAIAALLSDGANHPADHWGAFLDGLEDLLAAP